MLTVDYDRLGAKPGDLVLDMGCGGGRHAFETVRRGCRIVAVDQDLQELVDVRNTFAAMIDAGELSDQVQGQPVGADALRLPFGDATFDRIICSEVLEHIPDDETAIGELARVVAAGRQHRRYRAGLVSGKDLLDAQRRISRSQSARGTCPDLPSVAIAFENPPSRS